MKSILTVSIMQIMLIICYFRVSCIDSQYTFSQKLQREKLQATLIIATVHLFR